MYGREYGDKVLSFEPSGALKEATLVMRDRETDSWWSIMSGDAIGGEMKGQKLIELPVGEKIQWGEWKKRYPLTLVLTVDGREHDPENPYERYFTSERLFGATESADKRLPGKEAIYSFRIDGVAYAVLHSAVEGGAAFTAGGNDVFFYRSVGSHIFESTIALFGPEAANSGDAGRFVNDDGWQDTVTGAAAEKLTGFDTFWYSWSNINDDVIILN